MLQNRTPENVLHSCSQRDRRALHGRRESFTEDDRSKIRFDFKTRSETNKQVRRIGRVRFRLGNSRARSKEKDRAEEELGKHELGRLRNRRRRVT